MKLLRRNAKLGVLWHAPFAAFVGMLVVIPLALVFLCNKVLTMIPTIGNTKFCWLCGKDVVLEHCTTDEHGLTVHKSCHEKKMLLKAASQQTELWRQTQARRDAA